MSIESSNTSQTINVESVRPHADLLVALPEPPKTFVRQDVPDGQRDVFKRLVAAEMIERVRKERVEYDCDVSPSYRYRYRVDRRVHQIASHVVANRDAPMPCGHSGIQNLGDDKYTCCYDECDLVYDRSEVQLS